MSQQNKIYVAGHRGMVGSATRLHQLGWQPQVQLEKGLALVYKDFINA